jgi:hypothetical protein
MQLCASRDADLQQIQTNQLHNKERSPRPTKGEKSHAKPQRFKTRTDLEQQITEAIAIHKDHEGHEDRAKLRPMDLCILNRSSVFVSFVIFVYRGVLSLFVFA